MLDFLGNLERTHMCGDLRAANAGQHVVLMGWVNRRRDHGNLIFLDVRDRSGIAQIVLDKELTPEGHAKGEQVRPDYVVAAVGKVRLRSKDAINPKMPTGEVEIEATELRILNDTKLAPFSPAEDAIANEEVRLKHRYIDLRRAEMQRNFLLRHEITRAIRESLSGQGFLEIETPILCKSTPEGARDFLVPSRVHAGEFYALPQSPQIFKQILMISGFDRYFQIARCFRDEDQRADRQLEFTQIDVEMSFARPDLVFHLIEPLIREIFREIGQNVTLPMRRMPYAEAIARYGSDKPDLRCRLEICDLSDVFRDSEFRVFKQIVAERGAVRGFVVPGGNRYTRSQLDVLVDQAKQMGFTGLIWVRPGAPPLSSVKSLCEGVLRPALDRASASADDLLLMAAGPADNTSKLLGALRLQIAQKENL